MLNICYIIWKFKSPSNFISMGGAENQLKKLLENYSKRNDINIVLFAKRTKKDSFKEKISNNIHIYRLPASNIPLLSMINFSLLLFIALLIYHLRKKISVIHLPLPDLYITIAFLFKILFKIPVIARIAADELRGFSDKKLWKISRKITRRFILKMDAIQSLNDYDYKIAQSFGFNENDLYLIPNCVNLPENKKEYSTPRNKVIYIGGMRFFKNKHQKEQKNLKFLIDAFADASLKKPDLRLILVGEGNYRLYLEKYVREKGIQAKVSFEGYQLSKEKYLLDSDIFINPSHIEGMPNTVLEAMSYGLCVLCSNIPEHRYIIGNSEYGTLFDNSQIRELSNLVLSFYENPKVYIQKAELGEKYIRKNFSIGIVSELIIDMYKSVSTKKKG